MKTSLENGEHLLKKAHMKLERGQWTHKGKIYLTDRRLILEYGNSGNPDALNTEAIPLNQINAVELHYVKRFGILSLPSDSFYIHTAEGHEFRVRLQSNGKTWVSEIMGLRP